MSPPKPKQPIEENGWHESQKLVLSEIRRVSKWCEKLDDRMISVQIEIAQLKIKAGVWGLVGGLIPVAIAIGLILLKGFIGVD